MKLSKATTDLEYTVDPSIIFDCLSVSLIQAEKAYNEGHLLTAIARSTSGLNDLLEIKNRLLSIRMKAYQEQYEFSKACKDAESLGMTNERDLRKSVHMARLFMKQERMLDVIETCDTVLKQHPGQYAHIPEGNKGYKELKKLKEKAAGRLEHRVDFGKRLPRELMALVLDQLSLSDILYSMDVARHWREHILHCPTTSIHSIVFSEKKKLNMSLPLADMYKYLGLIGNHVKHLSLDDIILKRSIVTGILKNVSFCHLQSLNINSYVKPGNIIIKLLENSKHSLEEVYFHDKEPIPPINRVLDICSNLKLLFYCRTSSDQYWDAEYQVQQQMHTSLTHLQLYVSSFQNEDIKRILEFANNLQEFTIKDSQFNSSAINIIHKYGKHIRHISIGAPLSVTDPDDDDIPIDITRYQFSINSQDFYDITAQSLLLIIKNMEYKVEAISLTVGNWEISLLNKWNPITDITLPNLRYLKVSFTQETEEIFAIVIRQCPTLEEVILFRLRSPPDIILDAVTSLPMLQSFAIENTFQEVHEEEICSLTVNDSALRRLFLHHVSMESASTLQHVRLRYISDLTPETFHALVKIKHLKTLHLAGLELIDNPNSVIRDMGESFTPPELETLVLEFIYKLHDADIFFLDCPTIEFYELEHLTLRGIQDMVCQCQKLKKLIIRDCKGIDDNMLIDFAREKHIQLSLSHDLW